jgi:MFS family permease
LVATFGTFLSIVLVDVASSFNVTIGTASQISLIYRFSALVMSIVMAVICLKFRHKLLYLFGILLYGIGALGSAFSSEFYMMEAFQFFFGVGGSMTTIMVYTLIGDVLPLEKRGKTIGYAWSSVFAATISVPLITFLIVDLAGWRYVLSHFIFPLSLFCFVFGLIIIPSNTFQTKGKLVISGALKKVLTNKSAVACVLGTLLIQICFTLTVYTVSFFRLDFSAPLMIVAAWSSIAGIMGISGSLIGGQLINRIGRKTLTIISGILSGILVFSFTYIPSFWFSAIAWAGSMFLIGMAFPALYALVLEQVPQFRGSLMSINQSFRYAGTVFGLIIGGIVLNLLANNFQILMTIYGTANLAMALIIFIFAVDVHIDPEKSAEKVLI